MPRCEHPRTIRLFGALLLCVLAAGAAPGDPRANPNISYTVDVRRPAGHLIGVCITVEGVTAPTLDFSMPAWLPGYSKIQDFAKNVQEFTADDGMGKALPCLKTDKQTWRVSRGTGRTIRATYKVFANNLRNLNIAAHADESHAFFNGAAVFCYIPGLIEKPVTLRILQPEGWNIATGLERSAEDGVFRAESYDNLVDCPTEIGTFASFAFEADRKLHRIAIYGLKDFDAAFIVPDVSRIVQACSRLFGGLPYREYTFIYHLIDRERRSGVEHANSTAIIFNRKDFCARRFYDSFLNLTAHEYLHLWNIKRIHPRGWGPFDYSREAYTKSHWFTEGMTSYYAGLVLVRAGLWTPEQFYANLAGHYSAHENAGGKKLMSLEDASWDIWLKPDNAAQTTISYYEKGAVVGLMLDLEIRKRTNGGKSLDDVMRELDRTFGARGFAYADHELLRTINSVSGSDFTDFYAKYVGGKEDLPLDAFLSSAGLELVRIEDPPTADLGVEIERSPDDQVRITNVVPGGPGSDASLDTDDIVLALNGERVRFEDWPDLLKRQEIGGSVILTLYRRDGLMTRSVSVERIKRTRYGIREAVEATAESVSRRRSLLCVPATGAADN
jgi:predicted metalloprotease with PDZ domain